MPLPVIHSYAGYSIYKYSLSEDEKKSWRMAALLMVMANLPDLDMLPGMFFGNAEMFHRSATHSLAAGFICSIFVAVIARLWKKVSFAKIFWISLAAYFSHIFLDALTGTVRFMFWPFKIVIEPLPLAKLLEHAHPVLQCRSLGQFCSFLVSSTLMVRLGAETILVFLMTRFFRLFPKYRVLHSGVSESPAFIAGLAIFIFAVTTLLATGIAG